MKELFRRMLMRLVRAYVIIGVLYALGSLSKEQIVGWELHVTMLGVVVVWEVLSQMVHRGLKAILKEPRERDR